MPRNTRTFTDLDFNFTSHPKTSDVTLKNDEEAIKQSIKNLILTRNYERPFRSEIGSQINSLLFEPVSLLLISMLEQTIKDVIYNFEPRVVIIDVTVDFKEEYNQLIVYIVFKIKNTMQPVSVSVILERTR